MKIAYSVGETLELLSIGRTSLYEAVKRGELKPVKFGRKTLFFATDLTAFLAKLSQLREARTNVSVATQRVLPQGGRKIARPQESSNRI